MSCCKELPRWKIALITITTVISLIIIIILITSAVMQRGVTADVGDPIDSLFGSTFKQKGNNKVLIIGAGSSGLFAAYTLAYLGIDFQLLEANNFTYGGRVRELQVNDDDIGFSSNVPLDLGAEWIHVNPRILQDLLLFNDKVDDIETIEYQPQSIYSYDSNNGKNHRMNWLRWFYKEHKFYNSTWYSYFEKYVYPYVADKLELDSVVESIDYSNSYNESAIDDAVIVTTTDGRLYSGSHVIVATPVTILQNNDVKFIPPMPTSKIKGLDQVYMGPGFKIWLEFDDKFYPDMQLLRSFRSEENTALYFDALFRKPTDKNILCFLQVGNGANERVKLDNEEILNSILKELDEIFDGKASKHFIANGYYVQNWSDQPFIKGTYSLNEYDMKELLTSVNRCVYFCGEYMNEKYQATVHGAAISGRDTVKRLINENTK